MAKTIIVNINELNVDHFVRKSISEEHVEYLALLLEDGTKLPPIEITPNLDVIDGRHRIEAHKLVARTDESVEIEAVVRKVGSEADLIYEAYRANLGGSLPPTLKDSEHTIALLLARGETQKDIAQEMRISTSVVRRMVKTIKARQTRAKVQRAIAAIVDDGLTVPAAAAHYDIDPTKIKEAMSSKRKRRNNDISSMLGNIKQRHTSLSQKNAAMFKKLMEQYEDGDVTIEQVYEIIEKVESAQKNAASAIKNWRKRFAQKTDELDS